MKVAIFADVDKTITREIIQREFARRLKCEPEYLKIENAFQTKTINSDAFGDKIIELFNRHGFNEDAAKRIFPAIDLQPWAAELLKLGVDRYFVSSGPSYYIDHLAREYDIPDSNVCCSQYLFDPLTKRLNDCKAVDHRDKIQFVQARVAKYDITIGIGDDPEFDQFVNLCTIPLLTVATNDSIYVPKFALAVSMIKKLAALERGTAAGGAVDLDKLKNLPPLQLLQSLSTASWAWIAGILFFAITTSFGVGVWAMRAYPALFPPGTH